MEKIGLPGGKLRRLVFLVVNGEDWSSWWQIEKIGLPGGEWRRLVFLVANGEDWFS